MARILFRTPRLHCRHWRIEDLDALHTVYSDPEAMRWVGDGQPIDRAACEAWFDMTQANYRTRGYGMFALRALTQGRSSASVAWSTLVGRPSRR